jgi:hypothetical protein
VRIDNVKELAIVARALRLHHLLNKLGNGCISGDAHDDASVEHMAEVAMDYLRHKAYYSRDEDLIDWYLGNVDYVALEYAVLERSANLPEEVYDDISDKVRDGYYSKEDIDQLAGKAVKADKEWLRTDEGQEWINE